MPITTAADDIVFFVRIQKYNLAFHVNRLLARQTVLYASKLIKSIARCTKCYNIYILNVKAKVFRYRGTFFVLVFLSPLNEIQFQILESQANLNVR